MTATHTATETPSIKIEAEKVVINESPAKVDSAQEAAENSRHSWKTAVVATGLLVAVGAVLHRLLPREQK